MNFKNPKKSKLFISIIFKEEIYYKKAIKELIKKYREIDFESERMPFQWTTYYNKEMGEGLYRRFLTFKDLIEQENLRKIKNWTIKIEKKFSKNGKRTVNIDPGIITLNNLILATTKGWTHRIYLGDGIYADLSLIYTSGKFIALDWTYPDYRDEKTLQMLKTLRERLKVQLREKQ